MDKDTVRISGIIFEHGTDDFGLWEGFSLTEDEENAIWQILMKHDTEGCSIRGTRKQIAEEIGGLLIMTLEERLAIIEQKANNNKTKEKENKTNLQIKTQETLSKVEDLTPRIKAIITVANKCIDEGIDFPSESVTAKFGYGIGYRSYNFIADGINHHVGFMNCRRGYWREEENHYNKIEYLGIDEGGWNGVWDFYTNGTETFLKHEKDGTIKEVELKYLNDFLKEFDVFEEAFYKWIDSLAE